MIPDSVITRSRKRRRTVALRIEPDGSVRVQAPLRTSLSWINAFVASKLDWIARQQKIIRERKSLAALPLLDDGSMVPFRGQMLRLVIATTSHNPIQYREDQTLHLGLLPDLSPAARQAEVRTELTLWYKKQARVVFQERLTHWAERLEVRPSRLVVTNPQRRWGSCNSKNEIRLNWRLIMAAPEILDYVVAHELCHISHKNHGRGFWRSLEAVMPDMKTRRQALRSFEKSS